jgi:hypothetical protein
MPAVNLSSERGLAGLDVLLILVMLFLLLGISLLIAFS